VSEGGRRRPEELPDGGGETTALRIGLRITLLSGRLALVFLPQLELLTPCPSIHPLAIASELSRDHLARLKAADERATAGGGSLEDRIAALEAGAHAQDTQGSVEESLAGKHGGSPRRKSLAHDEAVTGRTSAARVTIDVDDLDQREGEAASPPRPPDARMEALQLQSGPTDMKSGGTVRELVSEREHEMECRALRQQLERETRQVQQVSAAACVGERERESTLSPLMRSSLAASPAFTPSLPPSRCCRTPWPPGGEVQAIA
jgi:hypothetical protein